MSLDGGERYRPDLEVDSLYPETDTDATENDMSAKLLSARNQRSRGPNHMDSEMVRLQ